MAAVVPFPLRVIGTQEIVPGCVLEVLIAVRGTQRQAAFVSFYFPPDGCGQVLDALQEADRPAAPEVYAGGDVNV